MSNHDNADSEIKDSSAKHLDRKKIILIVVLVAVCAVPLCFGIAKLTKAPSNEQDLFPTYGYPSSASGEGASGARPVQEGYIEDSEGNRYKVTIDEVSPSGTPEVAPFDGTYLMADSYELEDAIGVTARMFRAVKSADIPALTALGMKDVTQETLAKLAGMYAQIVNSQDTQIRLSFGTIESSYHQVNVSISTFTTTVIVDYNETSGYSIANPIIPITPPTEESQASEDSTESQTSEDSTESSEAS